MFSSPAPGQGGRATPRRRARDSVSLTPARIHKTPSLISEPRQPAAATQHTPSIRSSRLSLYRGREPQSPSFGGGSSAGETLRTVRAEYDGSERNIWARDDKILVGSSGSVPADVKALVKRATSSRASGAVEGHVDPTSGFAFVASEQECIAWNYQKRTHSSSTCYHFPALTSAYGQSASTPPVLAAFSISPGTSEPGLVLVSQDGEVRFWETISLGLSGLDRFHSAQLALEGNDQPDKIFRIDNNVFIVTTTSSMAFRISITTHSGRTMLRVDSLTRPGGMFGRASTTLFTRSEDKNGITSVVTNRDGVWLLTGQTLQRWAISADHFKFIQEYTLPDVLGPSVLEDDWNTGSFNLEIHDCSANGHDGLAILASYAEQTSTSYSYSRSRSFVIVDMTMDCKSHDLSIIRVLHLTTDIALDGDSKWPRLLIPYGSHLAFVIAVDALLYLPLSGEEHEVVLPLKDDRNTFIGLGCKKTPINTSKRDVSPVVLVPLMGSLMTVDIHDEPLSTTGMDKATLAVRSKIEQAVFYGEKEGNPLSFELGLDAQGDIAQAAENVSTSILESTSQHMGSVYELRPQLLDRLTKLKDLIAFIRGNGLLSKVPETSRRNLSRDGEKAQAAVELWDYQNKLMQHTHSRSPQSLLSDSIESYMNESGMAEDDDLVRTFFRARVSNLARVLEIVFATLQNSLESTDNRQERGLWVLEANKIFITVMKASGKYREECASLYEIDQLHPPKELWTARDTLTDALETLYDLTEQVVRERSRDLGSVVDEGITAGDSRDSELRTQKLRQNTLKTQMTELAAALCINIEDKLRVERTRQVNTGADAQKGFELQKRYELIKIKVIRPLVLMDRVTEAYALAEHHYDFHTLVWLCHHPIAGQGQTRVQRYIERFGEEFAFVLYQWYIDQGREHDLMKQDEVYSSLLTKFFETHSYPNLAWMHHIACRRYSDAASDLTLVGAETGSLSQKHLISSIGKLAAVADIKIQGVGQEAEDTLNAIDDELDLIEVENNLRTSILDRVPRQRHSTDRPKFTQADTDFLSDRPAFVALLMQLGQQLLDGEALDIESLVDVLTLKELGAEKNDAAVALDRLSHDRTLPEGRKQVALLSIWRRIFIRDDWNAIARTSGRSEEAQRQIQRQTMTYYTLRAINDYADFPANYILTPFTASQAPLPTEISARFPDWPTSDIDALMTDHENEIEVLEGYLADADLEQRVKEVAELVRRDCDDEEMDINGDQAMMQGDDAEAEADAEVHEGDVTM